ncbi:GNAT family N-acetyltransferase [Pseudoclavibacter sp. RFBJ3]|uniref:GNAT family N-acetyltransferase n=1 Tax=unclassified Pseudoclavibacter TaxID=2615177 RepID=UPI000CE89D94|nr:MULTISPECIES: GNAT family protein [unclassified Pseudoclavibacter]MBF4549943.1 GNAT family N-acetyltransferase [Pseudoclavibacter sp. VKM Ac-2888]PPF38314.1 GNAT family N-acetyltransferase [Pseudoclavibacter sp. AY1H1]PPF76340.1 GNAT family N-acetyltransferase [Pseudoclavibacter sp. Z016]PPF83764.1 GNAT family N-acetyltransferase [Pseudoclavibacter sp. RFBJ5]PPF92044.1 GNAT family N-acetyltransferase [Pseudoclavibacter sp. RFBJ3]
MSASVPTLTHGPVSLRPIRVRDARELESVLLANREWLQPWEATSPGGGGRWDVRGGIRSLLSQASAHTALPFVITYEGRFAGQLTVSGISYGALSSATLGYWVAREFAGKGLATIATAMATDHCLQGLGLHRMEVCIRPENAKSLRVVEKLGFRYEGLRRRYIHIDGDWRDHFCFGVVREEVPQGVLRRWREGVADEREAQVPQADWERTAQPLV